MPKLLIKKGRVIDPATGLDSHLDLLVEDGKIKALGKNLSAEKAKVLDASGKIVAPGLIDIHTHLREPGREDEETIASGGLSAAKGGFTSIAAMPNTDPPADDKSVIDYIHLKAREAGLVKVYPIGAITKELKGEELAEMAELASAGAVAFSDDGNPVMDAGLMRRALEYAKMLNRPIISHCEDKNLSRGGQMNESYYSTLLGLTGIPKASEEIMIGRDILLAELTGSRLHLAHITTSKSVEMVRAAKERGVAVTCEVTPHHLILTDDLLQSFDTNYKVNPPLRSREDVEALREGLAQGAIDVIVTDHAPHALQEKEREFSYTPFGIIGLETALPLVLTELVQKKILSLSQALAKMTCQPAAVLGLDSGRLEVGAPADLVIFDPEAKVRFDSFLSKSQNSPFRGWELKGRVIYTLVEGKIVYSRGNS